jgi:hypothetical protein
MPYDREVPEPMRVVLDIRRRPGGRLQGHLGPAGGARPTPFCGTLELLRAIDDALDVAAAPSAPSPTEETPDQTSAHTSDEGQDHD